MTNPRVLIFDEATSALDYASERIIQDNMRSWSAREQLAPRPRTPLERQFLPAALEILETPAPVLPRAILWVIVTALAFTIVWAWFGKVDMVAVAPGKVIAADKTRSSSPPKRR